MGDIGPGSSKAVLIADDDEFFRAAVSTILTVRLGFSSVIQAGSFDEAVERLGESPEGELGLALFDLSMPGISNPANLRAVREAVPDLKLVVVSGSELRTDILASMEAGVHGYVPKGMGISELERALRLILEGNVYVPALITDVSRVPDQLQLSPAASPAAPDRLGQLTPRQRQVLELIVKGKSNKEIARDLGLGEGTVRVHMTALFRNLRVTNRTAAAAVAAPLLERLNG